MQYCLVSIVLINRSQYFTADDLRCKETGEFPGMEVDFLQKIDQLYAMFLFRFGYGFTISSAYRSPKHSLEKNKTKLGWHSKNAIDIPCHGEEAHHLLYCAILVGIKGIGVNMKGDFRKRFLHFDNRDEYALWTY